MGHSEDDIALKLEYKNHIKGYLQESFILILLDSGSNKTLISRDTVAKPNYLFVLSQESIEPVAFRLNN